MRPSYRDNPRFLILAAAFFYTGMSVCIKAVGGHIPVYESIFFRSAVSVLILAGLLWKRRIPFRAHSISLLMTRSLSGLLAMSCNFYALAHLTLGDAATLGSTFPIFVAFLSFLFLDERPTKSLFLWIAIALVGIGLILRPQLDFFNYVGLIALLASFFSAIVVVTIHQSHHTEPSLRIAFYFMATCVFVAIPIMMQHFIRPSPTETLLLLASGLFGTVGQIAITKAYGFKNVARLSPLSYFGVVLSFVAGLIFWQEVPSAWSIAGSVVVILCCIQITRLEKPTPVID